MSFNDWSLLVNSLIAKIAPRLQLSLSQKALHKLRGIPDPGAFSPIEGPCWSAQARFVWIGEIEREGAFGRFIPAFPADYGPDGVFTAEKTSLLEKTQIFRATYAISEDGALLAAQDVVAYLNRDVFTTNPAPKVLEFN